MLQIDEPADALRDRVRRVDRPHALVVTVLAPREVAGRAHQLFEGLGLVTGMQENRAHAALHGFFHVLGDFVRHLVVRHMAPPYEHVGVLQLFLGKLVYRVQRHGVHDHVAVLQKGLERHVNAVRVYLAHLFLRALVNKFIVNGYADHVGHSFFNQSSG